MNRRFISIALVLLWMGCITTQTTEQHGTCDELVKELKKKSCQIPGTFRNLYFWSINNKTLTCTEQEDYHEISAAKDTL